jgi:hypothetical protein
MPYTINPQVLINGVLYNEQALNGVTCTNGRTKVDEQPRAGYASITLVTPDNEYPPVKIDEQVVIKVDDSNGSEVTLWTGWVSDIQSSVVNFGATGWLNRQQITAVGSLSKLNRRLAGGSGYPKEFDGERIYDIIFETAGTTWADYNPTTTWAQVNPALQWQNADLLIGDIDQPGDFELTAYSSGKSSGLQLAQTAAASGLGILYECNLGRICYDDYSSRIDDVTLNGFTTIDKDAILANGLSSVTRLADLVNEIEVTYKANAVEIGSDPESIARYGLYSSKINTILENKIDAENRVDYYLVTRGYPRTMLNAITLALHLDQVSDPMRDSMLPMRVSKPVRIPGLPFSVYEGTFSGYVEGFTYTINRNELFLTLNVSDIGFSQVESNWLQVTPSLRWQDVNATLEWQEARVVA